MEIAALYQLYLQHPTVVTDTRKIQGGEIFFALTDKTDGNQYAAKALELGAAYAVIDNASYYINNKTIVVKNSLETLQQLGLHHRRTFKIPFIAITGSNGKTTTKELLHAVLSTTFTTYYTQGNLNNHIGVPLTLLSIKPDAQLAIIEMGANHQGEIASYCTYSEPTHVLINNCGEAHLEGFGGILGVRKGKGELYDYAKENHCPIFVNTDETYLQAMIAERNIDHTTCITYGTNGDIKGKPINNNGMLDVAIINPGKEAIIHTQLFGSYNFGNVMGAVAVGDFFGVTMPNIVKGITNYSPDNSRSQLMLQGTNTIILDAYNANPTSMIAAIKNFATTDYSNKVLMLGSMKEVGAESQQKHQSIITLLQQWNWNAVVLVGPEFASTTHNYIHYSTSAAAATWLAEQNYEQTAILIKGSRGSAMEKVLG